MEPVMAKTEVILSRIKEVTTPEVYQQISTHLRAEAADDTNNVNQNRLSAEMTRVKPAVLKEITMGVIPGQENMDNQNQNQGSLEDLVSMKPEALRQLRVSLRGEEFMDNQNQNQGTATAEEIAAKPKLD
jgi:hypothetical protein